MSQQSIGADARVWVRGGRLFVKVFNPDISLDCRDYDIDSIDENSLCTDEDGAQCVRAIVWDDRSMGLVDSIEFRECDGRKV